MNSKYFGLISFEKAEHLQNLAWSKAHAGHGNFLLGFELEPTVTLGARGATDDLFWLEPRWKEIGFKISKADRGGQATIHNPGQLIIFPTVKIREVGVRRFVRLLTHVSQKFLRSNGCETEWRESDPGLYTSHGKILSLGLRVRSGIVTHGLSINVHNDLEPFAGIRVCGRAGAPLDKLRTSKPLPELFSNWAEEFSTQLTRSSNSHILGADA